MTTNKKEYASMDGTKDNALEVVRMLNSWVKENPNKRSWTAEEIKNRLNSLEGYFDSLEEKLNKVNK